MYCMKNSLSLIQVGGCLRSLRKKTQIPEGNFLEVKALSMEDASSILKGCLKDANRRLTEKQFQSLVQMTIDDSEEKPSALRLKLLLDRSTKWKSYGNPELLPRTVQVDLNLMTL